MRKEFPRLLSEGTLGPLTLRNRIVMPAMDQNNCTEDGLISNKTLQHYEDRAKGGAGLLLLETAAVKWPNGATSKHQPSLASDEAIPGLKKLAERAHKHGARIIVQACHHGRISGLDISRDVPVLVPSIPIPSFDTLGMAYNTTNEELMETFGSFTGSIKIFAFSVSVIALIVAGIGIMNIMLVSVTERIKEIGIRKAIGATKGHILIQFLTEAVFLCQVGGIIGVVFGIAAGNLISFVAKVPAVIPIDWAIYGVVSCSLIGIGFGSYPAWRAANLDPVESMRFE